MRANRLGRAAVVLLALAGGLALVALATTVGRADLRIVARPSGNLIADGNMESPGADGMPSSWFPRLQNAPKSIVTVSQANTGHNSPHSLSLNSIAPQVVYGAYCQPVNLPEGTQNLVISFYYRTENTPMADVYVLLYKTKFAEKEWNTPYIQSEDRAIPQSDGWSMMAWRFRTTPGAIQALVAFRATGPGTLLVDDVALRPYPQVASCDLLTPGEVTGLGSQRTMRLQLKGIGASPPPLTAALTLYGADDKPWTAWKKDIDLKGDERREIAANFDLPFDKSCRGALTLTGREPDEVYDVEPVKVPAMLEGRIVTPAFRATFLRSVPGRTLEAAGTLDTSRDIARRTVLTARLAGSSLKATRGSGIDRPTPLTWHLKMDASDLLTGDYDLEIKAAVDGKTCTLSMPLSVAPETPYSVGYDDRGTLWVDGKPELPLGVYFATTPEALQKAKDAGYNFSIVPWPLASTALMDSAAKIGIKILIYSRSLEPDFWQHATQKFDDHPALLGWHLVGKPDAELTPPGAIAATTKLLRKLDPAHPVTTSLSMPSQFDGYFRVLDMALVWTDPIPQSGPSTVGLILDQAHQVAGPKPLWAIIQTIGHAWSWDSKMSKTGEGRLPTPAEHRCMQYLALVHGARGLVDYTYVYDAGPKGANFLLPSDAPKLWASVAQTNRKLAWIAPMITKGDWHPLQLSATEPINVAYWAGKTFLLAIAVNTTDKPAVYAFRTPPVQKAVLTNVYTGAKLIGTADGQFGVELGPYGVAALAGRLVSTDVAAASE